MKQLKTMLLETNPFFVAHHLSDAIDLAEKLAVHLGDTAEPDDLGVLSRRIEGYLKFAALDCEIAIREIGRRNLERAEKAP